MKLKAFSVLLMFIGLITITRAQQRQPVQLLPANKPFVHPGMMQNRSDLETMKQKTLSATQPWKDAFDRLKAQTPLGFVPAAVTHISQGPYGADDRGGKALMNSADIAYNSALLWYITGNKSYASQAIRILNAWAYTLWDFDGNNAKLLTGLSGYGLLNAAEVLRYSNSGWKPNDIDQFKRLILTVYYPLIKDFFPEANGNWDASMINTMLCISIFCDDYPMFNYAVEKFYRGNGNGGITKYIYPGGQVQEATRDWGPMYSLVWANLPKQRRWPGHRASIFMA